MSASHRESSSDPPRDTHYDSEHSSRRRRLRTDLPHLPIHYPGDGLDFRRPVMTTSVPHQRFEHESRTSTRSRAAVIDLTDEDAVNERSESSEAPPRDFNLPRGYPRAHAQRLPRFGRDVIEVDSSGEGEDENEGEELGEDLSNLPGANYLALPHRRARPHLSGLRRPARPPSPPTDMDDVEFLEERPRARPRAGERAGSRVSSLEPTRARILRERTVTPYPTGVGETIDLTEDNDDDIVHLNTRQRPAPNNTQPAAAAGGFGLGNIAAILREGGQRYGERLMQRLQGIAGLDGELMAQHQAYDHFNHNHNQNHDQPYPPRYPHLEAQVAALQAQRRHAARARAHRGRPTTGARAPRAAVPAMPMPLPGMMDYTQPAFDMNIVGGGPPTPTYTPPPPPEKGFTRGPEEDEVVVCPNCGDELAMGESEVKQEVWIVKGCGHVSIRT